MRVVQQDPDAMGTGANQQLLRQFPNVRLRTRRPRMNLSELSEERNPALKLTTRSAPWAEYSRWQHQLRPRAVRRLRWGGRAWPEFNVRIHSVRFFAMNGDSISVMVVIGAEMVVFVGMPDASRSPAASISAAWWSSTRASCTKLQPATTVVGAASPCPLDIVDPISGRRLH